MLRAKEKPPQIDAHDGVPDFHAEFVDPRVTIVKKDGGVYDRSLENYTTALAIVTFKECNKDGKYDKVIEAASKYLRGLQIGDGKDEKDVQFGGVGYGAYLVSQLAPIGCLTIG